MSFYRNMSLAAKARTPARGAPNHPGRSYRPPPPREFLCLECRARIPHEESASHAARCKGRP